MIRLIAAFILMLAPIMSVSTGTSDQRTAFTSHDLGDERGCTQGQTTNGCGGNPPTPFTIEVDSAVVPSNR